MDNFIFGGVAAGMAICVVNPADVAKSRMQMQGEGGSAGAKLYRGPFHALKTIAVNEGVKGLYRGLVPAICFQMVGNSVRFGVYYAGKKAVGADKVVDSKTNLGLAATAGGLAGLIAAPFFTIKTQLQVQSSAKDIAVGHQHSHKGIVDGSSMHVASVGKPKTRIPNASCRPIL